MSWVKVNEARCDCRLPTELPVNVAPGSVWQCPDCRYRWELTGVDDRTGRPSWRGLGRRKWWQS